MISNQENITNIIEQYRVEVSPTNKPMPYRKFAGLLSDPLAPMGRMITAKTVNNWVLGNHAPSVELIGMLEYMAGPESWQRRLAVEIMDVIKNGNGKPAG